jgi:hypothetical protein
MIKAKDVVVWTNDATREVRVAARGEHRPDTRGGVWGILSARHIYNGKK